MDQRFANNPAYVEYETLLRELHQLIADGKGDDPEADEVRERMDRPERSLNRPEINRLSGLSADLYMLNDEEILDPTQPHIATLDELQRSIAACEARGDWDGVLELLRRRPAEMPVGAVALLRSTAYDALGHHDTAKVFREFARRNQTENPKAHTEPDPADARRIGTRGVQI